MLIELYTCDAIVVFERVVGQRNSFDLVVLVGVALIFETNAESSVAGPIQWLAVEVVCHFGRIYDLACLNLLDHVRVDLLFLYGCELAGQAGRCLRAAGGEALLH